MARLESGRLELHRTRSELLPLVTRATARVATGRPGVLAFEGAYHGLTLGFYEGELLRRVDPAHRTLGQFFQDEIAAPLGEEFYIRLPDAIPNSRLATLSPPGRLEMFRSSLMGPALLAIVLPLIGIFMPFAVFWMRAHFLSVPKELKHWRTVSIRSTA